MRALIIGYGSIGARHYRILVNLELEVAVVCRREIDIPNRFANIAEALDKWQPNYVIIASRTHEHFNDLITLVNYGFDGITLIEKPLFHTSMPIPVKDLPNVYVGFNLRFHPVIRNLREILQHRRICAVHCYVGQYLPDWRQGANYKNSYSASRSQGGGVLRDLSHELDYITWLLGGWSEVVAVGGKYSSLEIESDDVLSTPMCAITTINMNYLDTQLHREIHILTDTGTVHADLISGTIARDGEVLEFFQDRDETYIAQHLAILRKKDQNLLCSLDEGINIMELISSAELAANKKKWISKRNNQHV